jgi:hypothetical protein
MNAERPKLTLKGADGARPWDHRRGPGEPQRPDDDSVLPQRYKWVDFCGSSGRQITRQ